MKKMNFLIIQVQLPMLNINFLLDGKSWKALLIAATLTLRNI